MYRASDVMSREAQRTFAARASGTDDCARRFTDACQVSQQDLARRAVRGGLIKHLRDLRHRNGPARRRAFSLDRDRHEEKCSYEYLDCQPGDLLRYEGNPKEAPLE